MQLDLLVNMALEVKSCLHYSVVDFARIGRNDPTFGTHPAGKCSQARAKGDGAYTLF